MAARTFIEKDPAYSTVAARLLMDSIRREALTYVYDAPRHASQSEMTDAIQTTSRTILNELLSMNY